MQFSHLGMLFRAVSQVKAKVAGATGEYKRIRVKEKAIGASDFNGIFQN